MSKLSFRARALDATKPMPIYKKDELSDLQDYSVLNRAVPQMPSGMEKEEESEHHLQRAISAQQVYGDAKVMVIPVPEAEVSLDIYNSLYKKSFRLPKHYVHNQAQALNSILEQEKPDYDMDSEDERWVRDANKRVGIDVTADQFEEMIDRLEKSCGNQIVTLQEAKLLLKEDDDLIKAVYDYWTRKRLRNKGSLVFQVRQERRDGSSNNDSYVAFRRRTEKMQTRKNRKNDESSYEKMLKLRRELSRAVTILEMVKRREKSKRELLHLTLEIVEKRYQMKDWDEKSIRSVKKELHSQRTRSHYRPLTGASSAQYRKKRLLSASFAKSKLPANNAPSISRGELDRDIIPKKLKKKRQRIPLSVGMSLPASVPLQPTKPVNERIPTTNKAPPVSTHSTSVTTTAPKPPPPLSYQEVVDTMTQYEFPRSSDEDSKSPQTSGGSPTESFDPKKFPDGVFTFRRKPGCSYNAPGNDLIGDWPWMSDPKHRYSLMSLSVPDRCVGFTRRRIGRGGRIHLDRAHHPYSRQIEELDLGRTHDHLPPTLELQELAEEIKENQWRHYTPTVADPPRCQGNDSSSDLDLTHSWSSTQLSYDFGRDFADSKSSPSHQHGTTNKKRRQTNTSHKNLQGSDVVLGLDKSSIAFAVSALVTMPTTTPSTVTITTDVTKSSRVTSSASQCRPSSEVSKANIPTMHKCVTCGGIVNLTSTVTDMRAGHAATSTATGQHRVLPVTLSLATTVHQSSGQRATVLPATMTVSMPKPGGGAQTPGVPAFLRISSSGAVVGGTVLYAGQQSALVKSDDGSSAAKTKKDAVSMTNASNTPPNARRALGQRNAVNVNLTLPANVRINSEAVGVRATQSAPNSPRSHPGHGGEGGSIVAVKPARSGANSKTISLNLSNLTNKQAQSNISTTATPSGQVFSTGRITIANMMKRTGGGAFFSVAIPQTGKFSSSTPATSSIVTTSGDSTLLPGDGNVVMPKPSEGKPKARTKVTAEQQSNSRPDLKPMTLAALTKSSGGASSEDATNHTVQINLSSSKTDPPSSTNILDPMATAATNTVPVKSSKPSRPMEVT